MPRNPDVPCTSCGRLLWRGSGSAEYPRCRECRKRERCGTVSGYRKGCRCDRCREAANADARERRAQKRETRTDKRFCVVCGLPLALTVKNCESRPVHKKCRHLVPAWCVRGDNSPKVRRFRQMITKAAEGQSGGQRVWIQGPCEWCGTPFLAASGRYCSSSCKGRAKEHRYLSNRGRFSATPSDRTAIYVRDGWICQLCFMPVLQGLESSDNGAATLDHVVPRSKGGGHFSENLQLAHRWCNSMRRDLDLEEARCLLRKSSVS